MQPDVNILADQAQGAITRLAKVFATLAGGVAIVGLLVTGLAMLTGLAALDGSAKTVWTVVGTALLITAVAAPLAIAVRLWGIPRHTSQLAAELRSLIESGGDARTVVIETTESVGTQGGRSSMTTIVPTIGRLRMVAAKSGGLGHLEAVARTLMSLPVLLAASGAAILIGAGSGFVLLLILLF